MSITFRDPRNERTFGGTGGDHFNHTASSTDQALVGLEIWSGDVVDAVVPIFAQLLPGGLLGPIQLGPKSGGPGGRPTMVHVPGQVLVGIWVHWGAVVDKVRLAFRPWTPTGVSGRETWSDIVGGQGGDQGPAEIIYEPGRCAIAIHGKAGPAHDLFARLDSIGLVSAEPVIGRSTVDEVPREVAKGKKARAGLED